ncbi:DUF2177 family protein [Terrarubrum flagellatum]|uniref:DUF2177 family protein n=1 Tax=Terrirubrum flagellatum TaxID=2895980 RepID=UPI0031453C32
MTATRFALLYVAALIVCLPLDAIWLSLTANSLYRAHLGPIMLDQPRWAAAIVFYLLYGIGVALFCMTPALSGGGWTRAALLGAAFGFFCYVTYDATNHATLRDFPLILALIDVAWGVILTATAAGLGFLIATRVFGVAGD